jgi:hypothetical protein
MPELALDHDERDSLMRHLDRVRVPQLMCSEPPPEARCSCYVVQLLSCGGRLPPPPGGRPVNHAQHRADREVAADL